MECNPTIYREKIDNNLIQVEGEIYCQAKSAHSPFGSNAPSSGMSRIILMMLNQRWMFKNTKIQKLSENLYIKKKLAV